MSKEHVIVEAKSEYTKQLVSLLTQPVYNKMTEIHNECAKKIKDNSLGMAPSNRKMTAILLLSYRPHSASMPQAFLLRCTQVPSIMAAQIGTPGKLPIKR